MQQNMVTLSSLDAMMSMHNMVNLKTIAILLYYKSMKSVNYHSNEVIFIPTSDYRLKTSITPMKVISNHETRGSLCICQ